MNSDNFFWGGPVHNILIKLKLERESGFSLINKIIFFAFLTWLPLLILNLISSTAINPSLNISFFSDYVVWTRFFVALPVLFISERVIKLHLGNSLNHFTESGLVAKNNIAEYKSLLLKFNKIRDSKIAEAIIMIIAYAVVLFYWRVSDKENMISTWVFDSRREISIAGFWYYLISAPIFQFFLYRLIWKFLLWTVFLFRVSRMKLNLIPTDPDLAGGLLFLGVAQIFFGFIGLAQSSVSSASIAERIMINNTQLADYKITILINILVSSVLLLSPLLLFINILFKVKLKGMMDYGVVAHHYVHSFDDRWIKGLNPKNKKLLGTLDIQSLADLYVSYQIVEKMRIIPIDWKQILYLIIIIALPFLPLITFVIPPKEILESIIKHFI